MKLVPASESLARYLGDHSTALDHSLLPHESLALEALRRETLSMPGSEMQISREQGSFMYLIARLAGARKAVELGCYTGYSAISVAAAMPQGSLLVTIDKDPKTMEVACRYFERTGQSGKILPRVGDARAELDKLINEHGAGSFDLAFIDADKAPMLEYLDLCLKLVRPGGLILADNTLWNGDVANPAVDDKSTQAIREFNTTVARDPRVECTLVNIADGIMIMRVV